MVAFRSAGADVATAKRFLEWSTGQGLNLRWTHGDEKGHVQGTLSFAGRTERYTPVRLRSGGVLVLRFDWIERRPATADGKLLAEFQSALAAVPLRRFEGDPDGHPRFPIGASADSATWKGFTGALGFLVRGIRAWYAERGIEAVRVNSD